MYKRSLNRAKRALQAGFSIESIALTASLLADRLESCLALITKGPVTQTTVGAGARALLKTQVFPDPELLDRIRHWAKRRNVAVHEFAKINDVAGVPSWRSRLIEAREVADVGLGLLAELTRANKSLRQMHR